MVDYCQCALFRLQVNVQTEFTDWPNLLLQHWHLSAMKCCSLLIHSSREWAESPKKSKNPSILVLFYHPPGFIPQDNWSPQTCRHSTKWAHYGADRRMLKYFPSCIFPPHRSPHPQAHAITEDVLLFVSQCNYNKCKPNFLIFFIFFTPDLVNKLYFINLNAVGDAGMHSVSASLAC